MAKNQDKGRVRVFFAEIEGDNETIQDGLKAMAAAVGKTFQPTTVVKVLPSEQVVDGIDLKESEIVEAGPEDDLEELFSSGANGKSKPKRKRKPPTMSLEKDLDLHPDGKQCLRDFFAEKNPTAQLSQVAVFVYWLGEIAGVNPITANHVYTCFDHIDGVKIPNDVPQIIRNAGSKHGWVDPKNTTDIRLATAGKNMVELDLPKKEK